MTNNTRTMKKYEMRHVTHDGNNIPSTMTVRSAIYKYVGKQIYNVEMSVHIGSRIYHSVMKWHIKDRKTAVDCAEGYMELYVLE